MDQALFIRRFEPAEFPQIFDPGGFEREHHFSQIEPLDFRQFLNQPMSMFLPRPKPHANARRGAARPARALVGGRLADLLDEQRVDAAIRIVTRNARQPAVNHQPDAVNGQRGLGDVGGNDHLALAVTRHRGVLVLGRKFAVQRKQNKTF